MGEADLSDALIPELFKTDDLANYGIRGMVTAFAFDPVQGLFALGTNNGYIHVFGQKNVEQLFSLKQGLEVCHLTIVKSIYLVSVDASNTICVFSLDTKELLYVQSVSGKVLTIASDPVMDWLLLGLETGLLSVFDVDRGVISPYYVGNLQKAFLPKSRMSPVLSVQFHPRDPSKILVAYRECAIVFNIISQQIVISIKYDLVAGAPGGDTNPAIIKQFRSPPLVQALWHPHGHHILTVHVDGSLVFWDATEGVLLQARTLTDIDVNLPQNAVMGNDSDGVDNTPITKVSWVCTQNPEETAIIVAGGHFFEGSVQGVTLLDFGVTPIVSVTSYQNMGKHYANPRRQRILPTPGYANVVNFIPITRANPFYGGGCDPTAVIFLLTSGELVTLSYPNGLPITSVSAFPSAFSWVGSYVTTFTTASVPHNQWVGMLGSAPTIEPLFIGGAPAHRRLRKFDPRNALCTGHKDGSVRLWDASHGELDDSKVLEVQTPEGLKHHDNCSVQKISFAPDTAELAVAVETGEVLLYKFGSGKKLGNIVEQMGDMSLSDQPIISIKSRTTLKRDGFLPQFLINTHNGAVSSLLNTEVGFVVIGYKNGNLTVIDLRGPAIIFSQKLSQLALKKSKFIHKSQPTGQQGEYPTALDVGIFMLDGEKFSSIVLSVGTSLGKLHTFRLMPLANGGYAVDYIGVSEVGSSPIFQVVSINMNTGRSCRAKTDDMNKLPKGIQINGAVATISKLDIRIVRSPKEKIAARTSSSPIVTGNLSFMGQEGTSCLVTVTRNCETVVYGLPNLREISKRVLPFAASPEFIADSTVMQNGDVLIRRNQLSAGLITIWGRGVSYSEVFQDALFDPQKVIPSRPVISAMQWIKGTPVANIADVDAVVGGSRRPKSKNMIEQERLEREQRHLAQRQTLEQRTNQHNNQSYANSGPFKGLSNALDNLGDTANEYMFSLGNTINENTPTQSGMLKSVFKAKFL